MAEYIEREVALSFPFANGEYDHDNANEHFIFGCETYKEWLEQIPVANVVPAQTCKLIETREPIEGHPNWYRKRLCCDQCGEQIRLESWDGKRMFGAGTVLRENKMPNFCPTCGAKVVFEGRK